MKYLLILIICASCSRKVGTGAIAFLTRKERMDIKRNDRTISIPMISMDSAYRAGYWRSFPGTPQRDTLKLLSTEFRYL